nr:1659_t:CDS:2 [Entrophospora candida]
MNIYETTSMESADAIADLEDQTGETTLLKASYNRHILQRDAAVSQKVRVTSSQSAICPLPRRITGYNSLVTTPSPLFRRSNFVVDKGLQTPEERSIQNENEVQKI